MQSRRPGLEGDNRWRGHATAFVKYVKLHSEALHRVRVKQAKREAAYFIVVLHELKSVVIALCGTETPEDLITDGLCSECSLSEDDLYGLLKSSCIWTKTASSRHCTFHRRCWSGRLEEGYDEYDIESQTNTGSDIVSIRESVSQLMYELPLPVEGSFKDHQEMYLPGLAIHMVPEQKDHLPVWKSWKILDKNRSYRAYIANRETFKDVVFSPYTFLDHLPWRCHYSMQIVLETRNELDRLSQDFINV